MHPFLNIPSAYLLPFHTHEMKADEMKAHEMKADTVTRPLHDAGEGPSPSNIPCTVYLHDIWTDSTVQNRKAHFIALHTSQKHYIHHM